MTTNLREVDGAVVLTVPTEILSQLSLQAGSKVDLVVQNGQLIVESPGSKATSYKLEDLLAEYDQMPRDIEEDRAWDRMKPVGREII